MQLLTDIKGEIDSNTIIVGDFNTPLIWMDRSSRQKINKEILSINDILDEMNLMDIYRTFCPKAADYTDFSSSNGTLSRVDHMLGHKTRFSKFWKIEIMSSIFFYHNAMRLEINYKKKKTAKTNMWRLNNMLVNNQWITEEIKEEIKKIPGDKWKRKTRDPKSIGHSKSS